MHPRGVCELRYLGKVEHRSADTEDFVATMSDLHEEIKQKLQDNNYKYKQREYLRRREVNFEVGDMVLAHLRNDRLPREEYNKLKMNKIGPCRILRKFSTKCL